MDISSDSIVTKLNQQATGKAELSYSYFAASIKKGSTSHAPPPKKLTEEEIQELNLQQTQSTSSASAWNAAGTFEERDLSVWVQGAVKDLLVGVRGDEVDGVTASIIDVVSCSGDACQWITRGKTTANFDLIIKLKWSADVEIQGKKVEGTARLVLLSPNLFHCLLNKLLVFCSCSFIALHSLSLSLSLKNVFSYLSE